MTTDYAVYRTQAEAISLLSVLFGSSESENDENGRSTREGMEAGGMTNAMSRCTIRCCFAVVAVLGMYLAWQLADAEAQTWLRLSPAQFPARVKAIVFEGGNVLDANHRVRWGQWTVGFGSEPPIAYYDPEVEFRPWIRVTNLICTNPVAGSSKCTLLLFYYLDQRITHCRLNEPNVQLRCPSDLRLE